MCVTARKNVWNPHRLECEPSIRDWKGHQQECNAKPLEPGPGPTSSAGEPKPQFVLKNSRDSCLVVVTARSRNQQGVCSSISCLWKRSIRTPAPPYNKHGQKAKWAHTFAWRGWKESGELRNTEIKKGGVLSGKLYRALWFLETTAIKFPQARSWLCPCQYYPAFSATIGSPTS